MGSDHVVLSDFEPEARAIFTTHADDGLREIARKGIEAAGGKLTLGPLCIVRPRERRLQGRLEIGLLLAGNGAQLRGIELYKGVPADSADLRAIGSDAMLGFGGRIRNQLRAYEGEDFRELRLTRGYLLRFDDVSDPEDEERSWMVDMQPHYPNAAEADVLSEILFTQDIPFVRSGTMIRLRMGSAFDYGPISQIDAFMAMRKRGLFPSVYSAHPKGDVLVSLTPEYRSLSEPMLSVKIAHAEDGPMADATLAKMQAFAMRHLGGFDAKVWSIDYSRAEWVRADAPADTVTDVPRRTDPHGLPLM